MADAVAQDIRQAAHVAVCEFETWVQTAELLPEGTEAHNRLADVIARAILAERERCAKKADEHSDLYLTSAGWFRSPAGEWVRSIKGGDTGSHNAFVSRANAASAIASAIRGGE